MTMILAFFVINLETFGRFLNLHQLQTLRSYVPGKLPDNISPVYLNINPGAHAGHYNFISNKREYSNCDIENAPKYRKVE